MFTVEVATVVMLLVTLYSIVNSSQGSFAYNIAVFIILFITLLFANFAEAIAEARGKAQADSLRKTREETPAKKVEGNKIVTVSSSQLKKGDVFVSDMFNLYKYENMLYVMTLSGKEIKDFLEMSYYMWTNQMKSPENHLLWFKKKPREGAEDRASFQNFSFNFDSASGIIYTVDVTKPKGEKITITSMADGSPFRMDKIYKVALNSYRGNGGGELLTKGSGIPQEDLKDRIIFSTDKDLRFYLMNYIEKKGTMNPKALNQWKFVPEKWTVPAAQRDSVYLFRSVQ